MRVTDETLKSCPFCGGEAEIWRVSGGKTSWVACMGRCATLVSKEHTTDADAIAAWNRRTALAVEGTEAKPVAFLVDDFHVAHSPVKARGKFPEPDHYLYPAKREADARDVAKIMGGTCTPLYTAPPAGVREALAAENERLRAALAVSDQPCVYCSLPADEWSKCSKGFPGCSRGDDAMGCPELGAGLEVIALKEEIKRATEVIESFIAETVDYMTRNNLGDPEKQHNVKWGRKVLTALRGQS